MIRLFRLALSARGPVLAIVIAVAVTAGATIAQMILAADIIAGAGFRPGVPVPMWLLLMAIAIRAGAVATIEAAAQQLATRVKSQLRLAAVASLIGQGRALSRERTGELVTAAIEGADKLDAFYRRFMPQVLATALVPVVIVAAVAWLDPLSAILFALTGPLIPLFMWLLGALAEQRAREQWMAMSLLGGRFLDTLQGLPTLTAFGRAPEAALALDDASEDLRVRTMSVLRVAFLSGFVLELAAGVSTAIVAVSIGVRLIEGWLVLETGLAVLLLTPEFYLPFRQLGQRHHAGMEGVAAAERIFQLIDAGPAASTPAVPTAGNREPRGVPPTLTVTALTHRYFATDVPAIENLSATFAPRTLTAITGPSGAGKSTLLNALLRLIEPTSGRMMLDGRDHATSRPAAWRQHFAFVPQRPRFLHATILANLRMGRAGASHDEVLAAARLAHADTFIDGLPDKYETVIDETASALSGGERQRLAIARALVKDATILVLDEPTSSLDAASEAFINDTLMQVRREHTVIVVTHRLDLTQHADHIICLDGGHVVSDTDTREVA